jgi:hypothetical protein
LEHLKRIDILKNVGHNIVWQPIFKMADNISIVAVAICCGSGSIHYASLYCRFLLALIKEVGAIVFLQVTGTYHM